VKELIARLEPSIPRLKASMLGAMGNVKLSHLLDLNAGALPARSVDEVVEQLGAIE
jgi:hypothetical protein